MPGNWFNEQHLPIFTDLEIYNPYHNKQRRLVYDHSFKHSRLSDVWFVLLLFEPQF